MQVEQRSIEFIPEGERHGKARDLFNVWFSGNMVLTNITVGAGVFALGLNVFWSIVAVVLGNIIGGLFMATHSAQGPKLGVPQMIQSRAQFGTIGAILPLLLALFMYIGFLYYTGLLAAMSIHSAFPWISVSMSLVIANAITLIITVYGYDLIHKVYKYFAFLAGIVFLIVTVALFRVHVPAGSWSVSDFHMGPFLEGLSIATTFLLTFAPYVADYSRYLPKKTSTAATFGWTYFGSVLSSGWTMILGVVLLASAAKFGSDPSGYFAQFLGRGFAPIMYVVIIFGVIFANILNLYCAYMAIVTTVEPFTKAKFTPGKRFGITVGVAIVATFIGIAGQGELLKIINDFMLMLQYVMVPWSAINLVDFYLLRHGNYDIKEIFKLRGRYGMFNWIAVFAYFVTFAAEIPFMNVSFFEGPISRALGHGDIAWVVALILPSMLYYFPMKARLSRNGELAEIHGGLSAS
ncbi:purine-cytosine permease family protein [Alicyclobacillus sp. ALC3]|uniref:purine-cytosine permease family protein n=1 Tax=Alicyclobacillus sp. ALC3 TaxID=2796143 RepID=UPI00237988D0|nr:cytosine permease [Alicyclobacillus sp. ALC3]WDL95968.1 cytosine permease [Alicyclobacillus sp. ALC3]